MTPEQIAEARQIASDAAANEAEHEANGDHESVKDYEVYEDTKLELADRAFALLDKLTRS